MSDYGLDGGQIAALLTTLGVLVALVGLNVKTKGDDGE